MLAKRYIFAIFVCLLLWILLVLSTLQLYLLQNEYFTELTPRYLPIYTHIGCLVLICLIITYMSYLVFKKNNFDHCISTVGAFIYLLLDIILVVNAFTVTLESRTKLYIESIVTSVLLFMITSVISYHYNAHMDEIRKKKDTYLEGILVTRQPAGANIRIPLNLNIKASQTSNISKKPTTK